MRILYTKQSIKWLTKYKINSALLLYTLFKLCRQEGKLPLIKLRIHIMPKAIHSFFDYYTNTLYVAVQSKASVPRCIKLARMLRNLLHELRHFIQYRIIKKPFKLTYSYRDAQLINSTYWNDPDEIDARRYEKIKLRSCYKLLIKQ